MGRHWADSISASGVWLTAVLISACFVWILSDLLWYGLGRLSWSFLLDPPQNSGREGGIGPVLVSTGLILSVCFAVSMPLGIGTAILLGEFSPPMSYFGRLVRRSLDVLAGVPSIIFGLFGNAFFSITLGLGFSILSGGLTLACMVLPILIRSAEEGFRAAPDEYRLGAAAVGMTRIQALIHLILPAAIPGIIVGFVLGVARAIAETAALIYTSGYVDRMPDSLLDSGRALSIHIYDLSMNISGGEANAYATALVLLGILLFINAAGTWIINRWHRRYLPL